MKRKVIVSLAFALFSILLFAQPDIKVQAPNLVGSGEQFNVMFVIGGEDSPSDFQWEVGDDFQLVWGPQRGESSQTSYFNGVKSHSRKVTYTYILMPKKTGTFHLQKAKITIKNKIYTSDSAVIEVVEDSSSASGQGKGSSEGEDATASGSAASISSGDLFMRLSLSKRSVMVGESITATLKLYQRVNIAGFENAKFPEFNGFWSQELQAPSNIEFKRENLDGKIFNSAVIRSWTLIPQQAGDLKIDPAELVCLVNVRTQRAPTGSIFDGFFQDDYQTIRKRISTDAVTVKVSKLPEGAPTSFGGGVGQFKMSAELSRDSLKTHDAASLKLTITGTGNVTLLEAPKLSFPPDFEVYDVKTSDVKGGKTFEYPFIPRSAGDFTIGPVQYSYFDSATKRYVTLESAQLEIKVAKGAGDSGSSALVSSSRPGVIAKDVRDLGADIRYITTATPKFDSMGTFFYGCPVFWFIFVFVSLLGVLAYVTLSYLASRRQDVVGSKNRRATKMARRRLSAALGFLKGGLQGAFYEELHKALLGYVSDKLNMDAAEMSKENISLRLSESGASEELAQQYIDLLDACEFARYAPAAQGEALQAHYDEALGAITRLDSQIGNFKKKGHGTGVVATLVALCLLMPSVGKIYARENTPQMDSLWVRGTECYAEGKWQEAIEAWNEINAQKVEHKVLYYNLGNAYYKSGELGLAILYYERALKLDPSYADAGFNLQFAQGSLQDKIESVPEFFLSTLLSRIGKVMHSNTWGAIAVFLFIAFVALLVAFLLSGSTIPRRLCFVFALVALLLFAGSMSFASLQKSDYFRKDSAIVMSSVVSVKSSPSADTSRDLFILHEGTKVKVLDTLGEWTNIELSDGRQGWLPTSGVAII